MSSTQAGKDTIYVDIDDEITSIIEKVRSADQKIVALVLPKRATVLQSIVNMKLLKRTSDDAKKHLVLITSEASLLPLAGSVGLHVAGSLQSKPAIPAPMQNISDEPEDVDEPLDMAADDSAVEDGFDPVEAASKPIGELAASRIAEDAVEGTIELDNTDAVAPVAKVNSPKNKKLKIPNFDSFRLKLFLGLAVLALLIVGYIFAFFVLPKATVTIHTDTSTITSNLGITLDTAATALDASQKIVPATAQSEPKTYSQQVPATGQKNNGTAATGTVGMSAGACTGNVPSNVPAGSAMSSGGLTYITQEAVSFTPVIHAGKCTFQGQGNNGTSISITAQAGGASYNTASSATFTVSGRSDISSTGSASGGTDNITKIVQQVDIDSAKSKISAQDTASIQQDLQTGLTNKGLMAVATTFVTGAPQVSSSSSAGEAADTVTVTEIITYSMLGVKQTDLKTLVVNNVKGQLDPGKQVILDDGVAKASFNIQNQVSSNNFVLGMDTKSVAGPQIDTTSVKKQAAGKKGGDVITLLKSIPGVTDVQVKYSPFWVSSVPNNTGKITVILDKSNTGKS